MVLVALSVALLGRKRATAGRQPRAGYVELRRAVRHVWRLWS